MRARLVAIAFLAAVSACKSSPPPEAANPAPIASTAPDPSLLLLCRGGAPASVSSRFDVSGPARAEVNGRASDYLAGLITIDMTIVKQAGSAGTNGITLDPGSCAYPTRSMYESEPGILRHYRHDTPAVVTWRTSSGVTASPVVKTYFDEFAADPNAMIRVQVGPEANQPAISRIIEWSVVTRE